MHILVVTKSTPDTAAKVDVNAKGAATWGDEPLVINPWDEYAVTEAMLLKEAHALKTTVLAVGPEAHDQALKHALAVGLDSAIRVYEESFEGQDSLGYAITLAGAVQKLGDVRLVFFGREQVDTVTDAHIFMLARKLGWPAYGGVSKIRTVDFAGGTIKLERLMEEGKQIIHARLPCVISVVKEINEPRYPSFINIRKASKATIPVWTAKDLGADPAAVAGKSAKVQLEKYQAIPKRKGSVQLIEGANEAEKAHNLIARLIEDKVL